VILTNVNSSPNIPRVKIPFRFKNNLGILSPRQKNYVDGTDFFAECSNIPLFQYNINILSINIINKLKY